MRITVHRGINQIGGCITEIATTSSKILIDLGGNLPDGDGRCEDRLADRNAVRVLTEGCDAVIYSHYHGDHTDLCRYVPATVPQYIGRIAKKVMLCKARTLAAIPGGPVSPADVAVLESMRIYRPAYAIGNTGDIRVTPFFVSHSACDAYMFLIEADYALKYVDSPYTGFSHARLSRQRPVSRPAGIRIASSHRRADYRGYHALAPERGGPARE